jgi:glycosyltransferase involved in cell wall biosynthesis
MAESLRLLVVSHPAVLAVNQMPYEELSHRGWDVHLVVPDRWPSEYAATAGHEQPALGPLRDRRRAVPVIAAGRPQRHLYLANPLRVLRAVRPDVVFLEQEPFSLVALQWASAARVAGVPFGVQAAENLDRPLPLAVRAARRWVLRRAAFVAARSPAAADLALRWGACGEVALVPHHVPDWDTTPRRTDRKAFRVGFAGRLVPSKGVDVLTEAIRRLDGAVDLVVVGDGPLREWLEDQDLGGARLRLSTLPHDRMAEAYTGMDVLVLPSRTTDTWAEQFGRVLVEALWCGVPVVGSDSGGIPWVIESTGGGVTVPEGDSGALAGALDELRRDPAARRRLGRTGRRRVHELFSVPATTAALEQQLRHAVRPWPRRPRVALVAHGIHDGGGMERACAELIRQGHRDVAFVVVSAELAPDLEPLVERWERVRVPMRPIPLKFACFWVRAALAVRRARADLVHTVGAIVPQRVDVAAVHFCHAGHRATTGSLAPPTAPLVRRVNTTIARRLGLAAERWCFRPGRVRALAAVSAAVRRQVERHYPDLPVVVTPNGVDPGRFRPDPGARAAVRDDLHAGDACVALFVGGDWDLKGLAVAIEAVAKARATGQEVVMWVVGSGDEPRFVDRARAYGIEESVRFFGPQTRPERFYQAADVFVLPSAYEAFSIACLEAAACGLPLVVPDIGAAGALVGNDEAGRVVDRDPSSVAAALAGLAADPERRSVLGREAQRRAGAFTWAGSVASVLDLYASLAPGGGS